MIVTTLDWQPVEVQGTIALTTVWVPPVKYSRDDTFTATFNSTVWKAFATSDGYYMCWLYTTVNENNWVNGNWIFWFCSLDISTGQIDSTFSTREWATTTPIWMVKTSTWYTVLTGTTNRLYQNNTTSYLYDIDDEWVFVEDTPLLTTTPWWYSSWERIWVLSDWSILVNGNSNFVYNWVTYKRLIKIKPDKTIDTTFNTNIWVWPWSWSTTFWVLVMPDDTIFVYWAFTQRNWSTLNRIIKLNADGTTDTSFVVGTWFNGNVFRVETDGTYIYCVGAFTTWKWWAANRIVKLDLTGTIAVWWVTTGASSWQIQQISFSWTDCYICWTFTTYNATAVNRLAKINMTTGAIDATFDTSWGGLSSSDQVYNRLYAESDGLILVPWITTVATWNWTNIVWWICKISPLWVLDDKFWNWFSSNQILWSFKDWDRLFCFINASYNWIRYYNLRPLAYTTKVDSVGKNPFSLSWDDTWTNAVSAVTTTLVDVWDGLVQCIGSWLSLIKTDYEWVKDNTYVAPVLSTVARVLFYDAWLTLVWWTFITVWWVTKRCLVWLDDTWAVSTSFVITNGVTAPTFAIDIKDIIKTTWGKYLCVWTFTAFQTHNTVNAVLVNTDWTTDTSFVSGITESGSSTWWYSVVEDWWAYYVAVRSAASAGKIYKLSSTWASLWFSTPTFNQIINKIIIVWDNIYTAGNFTLVNWVTCNYFVVIDKNTWTVVYNPWTDFNGTISDMVLDWSTLLITWDFTTYKWEPALRAVRIHI